MAAGFALDSLSFDARHALHGLHDLEVEGMAARAVRSIDDQLRQWVDGAEQITSGGVGVCTLALGHP